MSGVERDQARVKATGEVFTPTPLVGEVLDQLPQDLFSDPDKTFLDNSCGDGQFLGEVLIRKIENGSTFVLPGTHKVTKFPSNMFVKENVKQITAKAGSYIVLNLISCSATLRIFNLALST